MRNDNEALALGCLGFIISIALYLAVIAAVVWVIVTVAKAALGL